MILYNDQYILSIHTCAGIMTAQRTRSSSHSVRFMLVVVLWRSDTQQICLKSYSVYKVSVLWECVCVYTSVCEGHVYIHVWVYVMDKNSNHLFMNFKRLQLSSVYLYLSASSTIFFWSLHPSYQYKFFFNISKYVEKLLWHCIVMLNN